MIDMKRPSAGLRAARAPAGLLYGIEGTGLPRVAEVIRRRTACSATRHTERSIAWIDDLCEGLRFCCDAPEHMGSQIFFKGSYSGAPLVVLRRLLNPDAVFVDAGANQGECTVCAAGQVPEGHVLGLEPMFAVRERLERNIAENDFNTVTVHPVGLSDVSRDEVPIFGGDSTCVDGTQRIGLATLFGVVWRSRLLAHIELRPLDEVLREGQRVDVLKVDVDGAELAVLKGAAGTIQREKPAIMSEANADTCEAGTYSVEVLFEWLAGQGYEVSVIGAIGEFTPPNRHTRFCNMLALHPDRRAPELKAKRQ